MYLHEDGCKLLCIPENVCIQDHYLHEIIISEGHSLVAHLGLSKTLAYLRNHVWWKNIARDTRTYCESCVTCKQSKPPNQKPFGLLNSLKVATYPWELMGFNFVSPLPESSNHDGMFNSISVFIDLLTGMVHLVPSHTNYKALQVAELIFSEIYKHHGLPKNIMSDRDVIFTSNFWMHLHKLIGVNLQMSSAYHPESDGSMEHANRTITQMICNCVSPDQKDWVARLPAIEFAINSARSESTGYALFFLNSGHIPYSMIWNLPSDSEFPGVLGFADTIKTALIDVHNSILAAHVKQTRDANRHCHVSPLAAGDLVYLSTKNISLPKGLAPKFIGPYIIS